MAQQLSCRICLEPGERAELIAPCSCRGTSKFVHPECLHAWRFIQPSRAAQCTTCGASFLIRLDSDTSQPFLSAMYIRISCCSRVAMVFILSLLPVVFIFWLIYYDAIHNFDPPNLSTLQLILIYCSYELGKNVIREMYIFGGYTSGCLFVPTNETLQEIYRNGQCMVFILNSTIFIPIHILAGFLTMVIVVVSMPFYVTISYARGISTTEQLRSRIGRVEDLSVEEGMEGEDEGIEIPIHIPTPASTNTNTATTTTTSTGLSETFPIFSANLPRTYHSIDDSHV